MRDLRPKKRVATNYIKNFQKELAGIGDPWFRIVIWLDVLTNIDPNVVYKTFKFKYNTFQIFDYLNMVIFD
jgi:hypothetical protein